MAHSPQPTWNLLQPLVQQQRRILDLASRLSANFDRQLHQSLSPPGWHCGHCAYTENFWLREAGADDSGITEPCDAARVFSTDGMAKQQRAKHLPPGNELLHWLSGCMQENRQRLGELLLQKPDNELLQDHFLLHFLTEHAAQHAETMAMLATQQDQAYGFVAKNILQPCSELPQFVPMEKCSANIGMTENSSCYDNEKSSHQQEINAIKIATDPVSNSQWLAFIKAGGYRNDALWSAIGRKQRDAANWSMPGLWRIDCKGSFYTLSANGPTELAATTAVAGISMYEAEAFANWVGARLPHEYEWEVACKNKLMRQVGSVWEWCANTLHPYPGFRAFPYAGYSQPYFDGKHYVLRGGSVHTASNIRRPSFRNFYTAEARYLYSGVRLVRDA